MENSHKLTNMVAYQNSIVYFFSGTGNSKNVAGWFSNIAVQHGIDCQFVNIAQIDRLLIEPPDPTALIVFVSPIHGFNYPPIMLNFIMRFPKGKNKVVLMNTRAGMLIGKFITPGLTGIAFYLSALILKLKGFSIKAMFPVDLPSNWISLHPGLNERTVTYLHKKNKEKVEFFAQKILAGKSDFNCLKEAVQDIIISPLSIGYYFAGRFLFAKTYYASRDCNNCDICINGCPVKAIIKIDKRPFWTFNCESCMKCMNACPKRAIEAAHGFITVVLLIYNLFLTGLFYKYFTVFFFEIKNKTLQSIAEILLLLFFLFLMHRITHYCLRFRYFERLMVYTSLSKFKFWKRYKALKY